MPGTDSKRFSTLVEPHLELLYRAAWRLARNRADAEDLVQETCVRACERLDELRESGPVKSWLLRVMHNLYVDDARRAKQSPIEAGKDASDAALESASPQPTPEQAMESRQRVAQLERAWQKLDRGHQALLALRAEGYTLAEISTITNIAADALNMRLFRARQSLTRCLQSEQAPSAPARLEAVK